MAVSLQLETVAAAPLKATVPIPWEAPKFVPVMVTAVPGEPEPGCMPLIPGNAPLCIRPFTSGFAPVGLKRLPTDDGSKGLGMSEASPAIVESGMNGRVPRPGAAPLPRMESSSSLSNARTLPVERKPGPAINDHELLTIITSTNASARALRATDRAERRMVKAHTLKAWTTTFNRRKEASISLDPFQFSRN